MTRSRYRFSCLAVMFASAAICGGCGGSSHTSTTANTVTTSGSNVQPITVNSGPAGNYANGVFTSITVCVPSSSTCQTINSVLVDTGSYGLRLLSSAGGGALTLSLPQQKSASGDAIAECAAFVSGYTWGPVVSADITISGEHASNVPVQVIDPSFNSVPASCQNGGIPENDTLQSLGANGILGIGPYVQDCGGACEQSGTQNPGLYYSCSSSTCQVTAETLAQQVQNPVATFAKDNNGVVVELPSVSGSSPTLSGSIVFGIGTESNNGLGSAAIFPLSSSGEFQTTYKGQSYPAFVDSGSNAIFFLDETLTGMMVCSDNAGFYCPASQTSESATTTSGATSSTVSFNVMSADMLFSNRLDYVFSSLAGPNPGSFDWGLPFFFGRNVYTAIESRSTPAGAGPYWAY